MYCNNSVGVGPDYDHENQIRIGPIEKKSYLSPSKQKATSVRPYTYTPNKSGHHFRPLESGFLSSVGYSLLTDYDNLATV